MNLRSHYLLGLLLLIPVLLSAQQQEKLLYRISAQEYETILLSTYRDISFLQTRTPVATLTKAPEDSMLAAGYYVIISLAGEQIKWELWNKNHHSIYLHDDQKQLNLAIVDSVGQEVPHAQVRFAKREVDYKQATQRYESRRLRPGILSIYLPGDTIFYEIETAKRKSVVLRRFGYFSGSRVGSVITWPIRLIRGPIGYLRRGFRWGDWHIHKWPFERLYRRIKAGRDARKVFNGFVASQQPLYRHGDTVKIAATLAKANGRPYRRSLQLTVRSVNKTWIDTLLQPELSGHYAFEWPLADSLPLDTRYIAKVQNPRWRQHRSIQHEFRLEDYELDEYEAERARPSSQTYISRAWYNTLGLDSLLYYQLRKPGQEVFTHYRLLQSQDSMAQVTAQIAPFVVRNNRAIPVHFIYLDNRLVYVSKAWQDTPYSIVAEPGYHQLTLRTSKAEIRLDSVLLQAGKQLVLSVDQLQVKSRQVQVLTRSPEWTESEIKLEERHLIFLWSRPAQQRQQY